MWLFGQLVRVLLCNGRARMGPTLSVPSKQTASYPKGCLPQVETRMFSMQSHLKHLPGCHTALSEARKWQGGAAVSKIPGLSPSEALFLCSGPGCCWETLCCSTLALVVTLISLPPCSHHPDLVNGNFIIFTSLICYRDRIWQVQLKFPLFFSLIPFSSSDVTFSWMWFLIPMRVFILFTVICHLSIMLF